MCFTFALESDDVNRSTAEFEEVIARQHLTFREIEDASIYLGKRLLRLAGRGDERSPTCLAEKFIRAGNVLCKLALLEQTRQTRARQFTQSHLFHLVHRNQNDELRWQGDRFHTDITNGPMCGKELRGSICSIEVERWRVENDESFSLLTRSTVRSCSEERGCDPLHCP
ncbi:hypothetical protein BDR07DRAFT_1438967 [Suillus spraguei]|nr:hypothetical protein BDR07DRAFT_1438967 [Suillus spraguei]